MSIKHKNLFDYLVFLTILIIVVSVYIVSEKIKNEKINAIKNEKYNIYSKNIYNEIDILLKNKQELTFSIALSLAQDSAIIKAIKENDNKNINLKRFSEYLSETTQLQHTWFHIIDGKGTSFYRSWTPKKGDSLLKIRMDVVEMIKTPRIMTTISTGEFDMTFKSMVPIYDNGTFIGIFEIITHFNSIAKQLMDQKIDAVVVVDKKYRQQIKKPFTKIFIGDYYIANYNAKKVLLSYLDKMGVENYIHNTDKYILDQNNNHFIVVYNIPDIKGKPMGSIIAFKKLDSLNMDDIKVIEDNIIKYTAIITLTLLLIGYYLVSKKHSLELDDKVQKRTKELEKEKFYIQTILDTNPNIIIVTNSFKIIDANKRFLEFFNYNSIDEFITDHDCICDFFVTFDEEVFCNDKMVDGIPWAEYVAKYKKEHIVQLKYKEEMYIFTVNAEYLKDTSDILLTFQNITEIKRKDKLLFEQSKLASMGVMIGNIAHQWRQPLSVISTGITGLKLQKEYNILSNEAFFKTCDVINDNAQYLSRTIEDFKNFIANERELEVFNLHQKIESFLSFVEGTIKNNNITVITEVDNHIMHNGYPNELIQCFLNIFNNSNDALKNIEDGKYFFISSKIKDNQLIITFKDNGGGIPDDILPHIFEPYFTTKHQSIGTGLGLSMTYNLITEGMKGTITAKNVSFKYNDNSYKGAKFTITLPLNFE